MQAASKEQSWRKVVQRGGYSDKLTAIAAQLKRLSQRITCEPGAETPMGGGLATPTRSWQTPRFVSALTDLADHRIVPKIVSLSCLAGLSC